MTGLATPISDASGPEAGTPPDIDRQNRPTYETMPPVLTGWNAVLRYTHRMRFTFALILAASPAFGWQFTPVPVCTLTHSEADTTLTLTHDPSQAEPYAIAITLPGPWEPADFFALRFDGPRGLTISTDRHLLSAEGRTLTVTDRGFGNVLDGLEFNSTATALLGVAAIPFALDGAEPEVRKFRACAETPTA